MYEVFCQHFFDYFVGIYPC